MFCKDFAELTAIQHVAKSQRCGVPKWPCTKPAHGPPPAPPHACSTTCTPPNCERCIASAPASGECPAKAHSGGFVPWVRAVNRSSTFGVKEGEHNVGIPLLGLFDTEAGCRSACEALTNCSQYEWSGITGKSPWNKHCFGRCDAVWRLSFIPGMSPAGTEGGHDGDFCPVSARRVPAAVEDERSVGSNHVLKTDDTTAANVGIITPACTSRWCITCRCNA